MIAVRANLPTARMRTAALLALAGVGAVVSQPGSAQLFAGHDSNAPVDYSADRIELQDKANRVVLSGNVDVTQKDLRLRAARVTVSYTNDGSLKIQRMIATGGVLVTRGTDSARGDVAVYDLVQRIITMSGNVTLTRNGSTLNGGRAVINLATGMSTVDGRAAAPSGGTGKGGRVSGTFTVAKGK